MRDFGSAIDAGQRDRGGCGHFPRNPDPSLNQVRILAGMQHLLSSGIKLEDFERLGDVREHRDFENFAGFPAWLA